MTLKERILQEIEESSPILLEEVLDFILFVKQRRQPQLTQPKPAVTETTDRPFKSRVKAFEGLFDNVSPVSEDIDPDQAKWEYLKEKHDL